MKFKTLITDMNYIELIYRVFSKRKIVNEECQTLKIYFPRHSYGLLSASIPPNPIGILYMFKIFPNLNTIWFSSIAGFEFLRDSRLIKLDSEKEESDYDVFHNQGISF